MTLIKLLILMLFIGCTHTTLIVNVSPTESIEMSHSSGVRRGCYRLAGEIPEKATATMEAHDRSASREAAAIATIGATAVGGPIAGGIAAVGDAIGGYFDGDKDSDQNCKFDK